jgi:hypothetical protein
MGYARNRNKLLELLLAESVHLVSINGRSKNINKKSFEQASASSSHLKSLLRVALL